MEHNIEYTKMAYLYDKFYASKNYTKEVDFIKNFITNKNCLILDAGCGTGNHAKILCDQGYEIYGFDLNKEMVEIANSKINNHFSVGNLLNYEDKQKYDLIISFYAVFNHLKNYKEFEIALNNLKACLKENGVIIIDLHNPQHSGKKIDKIDGATRIMQWHKCSLLNKEFSNLIYIIGKKKYSTKHQFKIFNLNKLRKIAKTSGFENFKAYEQYSEKEASSKSKNIQIVLS